MGDKWHDESHVLSHKEERKKKDLLSLWYKERSHKEERKKKDLLSLWYKERISESGGGNWWRKTKRTKKRKREREGKEREREGGEEGRSEGFFL